VVLVKYDEESDGFYASVSDKKAFLTIELSHRIGVDVSQDKHVVGVEILDASKVLSDLFGRVIPRARIKHVLCSISEKDEIYVKFELGKDRVSMAIPRLYKSPLLQVHC